MSRIADALKRASEIVADRDESHVPAATDFRAESSPLEQYAREGEGLSRAPRKRDDHVPVEALARISSERRDGIETVVRARDVSERVPAVQRSAESSDPPRPQRQAVRVAVASAFAGKLVGTGEGFAESAEQYERLAKTLQDLQARSEWNGPGALGRGLKTLLVSSAVVGEGKTLTAVNLALTLSESSRKRVLLIDTNLQHPSVHDALGLSITPGLADILKSDSSRNVPFLMISPRLSVLPAGRFDGSLMNALGSDAMRALLDEEAASFDWVILDGPAVQQLSHPHLMARLSRAVLFVIGSGSTAHPVVDRAMSEIGRGCVIGAVLNRVKVP